ncbi:MAG: dihydroorotase [Thermoflexaceae bacterium]|nr:dihydroorotase [Thermoflexaceae bacterium]
MTILIKNGRVLDPANNRDEIMDIYVEDGIIQSVSKGIEAAADEIIDATGCYVTPGLIDLHVHVRDPGFEYKETIKTGGKAAAKGGFTTVCPMPNTNPVTDNVDTLKYVIDKANRETMINVLPVAAITVGQEGEYMTDIESLAAAGAIAISEDGKSVMNARLYRQAMKLAKRSDIVVMAHCEDKNLVARGVLNAGPKAKEMGMFGIMNAVEDVIVARDILLAKNTGCKLHLCHCSTRDSVKMIALAKEEGLPVTGEVCPHHFTLTEDDITCDDANFKMNPPLRTKEDVEALKAGLRDGIMDVISTDHAPHGADEKRKSIKDAPFGITGLETSVCLTITELVETGYLTPLQMVEKMSYNPAKVIGIDRGTLTEGKVADITIIDPAAEWVIDSRKFVSLGKNTPFNGKKVHGKVLYTICNGEFAYRA